jgi:hypothetical protein
MAAEVPKGCAASGGATLGLRPPIKQVGARGLLP